MKLASTVSILSVLVIAAAAVAEDQPLVLDVWPGEAPDEKGDIGEEIMTPRGPEPGSCQRLTNVSKPTISLYRAKDAKRPTAAVLICPGGGYNILAWDKEGTEVADWLNSIGVTGVVLKYRVPRRKDQPKHLAPLQDAQRTMSLVRSQAAQWNIDPERIGILGFSAGGHLSATASTNFDERAYKTIDETDKTSCRPDFTVLIYPAYLIEGDALAPEIRVSGQSPPTFFVHAGDDRISSENSVRMYLALKKVGVKTELHVFTAGGHGFGLRPSKHPSSGWPQLCEQWMRSLGLSGNTP